MQVEIINPCKANGTWLRPEETHDLSQDDAAALIASGAAVEVSVITSTRPTTEDAVYLAIRTAAAALDTENADLWTQSGKAKTEALAALLGYAVTAGERDIAMERA